MEDENGKVIEGLKIEVYDLGKQVQGLSGFIQHMATALELEPGDISLDSVALAIKELKEA